MSLGDTLRRIREKQNLNIAQLAKETGMTSSHISQIERDLASPSVATLRKIASVLNVPISTFFDQDQSEAGSVVHRNHRKKLQLSDSDVEYELLSPDFTSTIQMLLTIIEPGVHTSEEPMSHGGKEECAVVMGGSVKFTIGGDSYTLNDGDSIYYDPRVPHKIVNTGETEVTIISAISPPGF